jgi:hypothetical protein
MDLMRMEDDFKLFRKKREKVAITDIDFITLAKSVVTKNFISKL